MSKEEKSTDKGQAESKGEIIKASIYESTDNKDSGGVLHTRIYCFETDHPILKKD